MGFVLLLQLFYYVLLLLHPELQALYEKCDTKTLTLMCMYIVTMAFIQYSWKKKPNQKNMAVHAGYITVFLQ